MFSPSTRTAFNAPRIEARGCLVSTRTGYTLALNPFVSLSICATSFIVLFNFFAQSKSSFVTFEIPSVNTSSADGDTPKQSSERIIALYLASIPSTSFVGSGSAYPSSLAFSKALLYVFPSSMDVKI